VYEHSQPANRNEVAPGRRPQRSSADACAPEAVVRRLLDLQRLVGNQATARLVQRKPADIDQTNTLSYDASGKLTNAGAARATGPTRTKAINADLSRGWVTPNEQLIGGHLFGRAFGGPDNETNVVPWSQKTEADFSVVETNFKKQADSDALANAASAKTFTATVKSQATFQDRPDLKVDEAALDKEGWPTADPGRTERIKKFDEVAEHFSGVPTSVTVTVSGLSTGAVSFKPSSADIAPTFARNPAALKQAFVETIRFKRNATETRKLLKMPDWATFKKSPKLRTADDLFINKKLGHVASRHPGDWGVTNSNSPDNLKALETKLEAFILDGGNEQIEGVYVLNKVDVLHYVNPATKLWVCTEPDGTLVASYKLGQNQYDILITKGTVG
jgi:hypothetical protein